MTEWIPSNHPTIKPTPGKKYLVFSKRWGISICTLDYWEGDSPYDSYWSDGIFCSHWAELPEEPKDFDGQEVYD